MTVREPADFLASSAMMTPIAPTTANAVRPDSDHRAAYLVLLGSVDAPKALLFDADHRYLSEVIDDSFVIDTLRSAGTRCPKPQPISLDAVVSGSGPLSDADVLCFALGKAA
jgi:hypothetical protein